MAFLLILILPVPLQTSPYRTYLGKSYDRNTPNSLEREAALVYSFARGHKLTYVLITPASPTLT
jgi:hypothetical protein